MPVWSDKAIDYSKGLTKHEDGTWKPNKIGCYVMTIEECEKVLEKRRQEQND